MALPTDKTVTLWQRVSRAPLLRLVLLVIVILLLQIPLSIINSQIYERQSQKEFAVNEVTSKWGGKQSLLGPLLVVPYIDYTEHHDKQGKPYREAHKRFAGFLPEQLNVDAQVRHETRQRGLFEIPLFQSDIKFTGKFTTPVFSTWGVKDADILWQESQVVLLVKDAHAIQEQARLHWNDLNLTFQPGAGNALPQQNGYHIVLGKQAQQGAKFDLQIQLNGSDYLYFAPVGNDTVIRMQSNWPDPSFTGKWLPTKRDVSAQGFVSEWRIAAISRGYGKQWQFAQENLIDKIQASLVGTDFLVAMDNYRMSERSSKYDVMFLVLTFLVVWLMEVMTRQRVHFIQYLLLGSALCLFYLLLTALAEHIGFYLAYLIASLAVIVTVSLYGKTILRSLRRGFTIGGIIAALYGYLFSLLNEQNYAFLIGSIGMFIALIMTMYLTRHIDWYNFEKQKN